MQYTSWEGILTQRLRRQGKLRGGYTKYVDRQAKRGLLVVKNRENFNKVYTPDGRLIGYQKKNIRQKLFKRPIEV